MFRKILYLILFALLSASCASPATTVEPSLAPTNPAPAQGQEEETEQPRTLTVMTHDSFAVSAGVIQAFESANNARVQFLASGDAGTALNKAILSRDAPLADVLYGLDNTFLSRALEEDIFTPYESPLLTEIPDEFELDPQHRALPVDYGDVCLNYDRAYFSDKNLPPPQTLEDLLNPRYQSMLVVQNPATSSPGLAFLFTTIGHFGSQGYLEFWQGLVANDVLVVNDWETAYYSEFSRWGGTRPIVVSYGSSPPFEVIFAEEPVSEPPTAAIVSDGTCFRQVEYVGILQGAKEPKLAEAWVDFMLSITFQEDIPLQMYVFPVNSNAQLDETFIKFLATPGNPVSLDPQEIAANRETWIEAWREVVLR
jgi:thiamine transport system substrate-binding protein